MGLSRCIDEDVPFKLVFGETEIPTDPTPVLITNDNAHDGQNSAMITTNSAGLRSFAILQFEDRLRPYLVLDAEGVPVVFRDRGAAESFGDFWEHSPEGTDDWKVIGY